MRYLKSQYKGDRLLKSVGVLEIYLDDESIAEFVLCSHTDGTHYIVSKCYIDFPGSPHSITSYIHRLGDARLCRAIDTIANGIRIPSSVCWSLGLVRELFADIAERDMSSIGFDCDGVIDGYAKPVYTTHLSIG